MKDFIKISGRTADGIPQRIRAGVKFFNSTADYEVTKNQLEIIKADPALHITVLKETKGQQVAPPPIKTKQIQTSKVKISLT